MISTISLEIERLLKAVHPVRGEVIAGLVGEINVHVTWFRQ